MANELDELTGPVNDAGRDVAVIEKQLPVKVGIGSKIFEVLLWILGIIPGVVFLFMKIKAGNYFSQLQQRIQHDASQIDNYLEQRVVILHKRGVRELSRPEGACRDRRRDAAERLPAEGDNRCARTL